MNEFFVKPTPGRLVRDPVTLQQLPAAGAVKERSSYWRRRLRDGDVVEVPAETAAVQPAPAPTAEPQPRKAAKKDNA